MDVWRLEMTLQDRINKKRLHHFCMINVVYDFFIFSLKNSL